MYIRRRIMVAFAIIFSTWVVKEALQQPSARCDGALHTVVSGETIWSIAHQHCHSGLMTVIHQLVDEYGTYIEPGDKLQLP